MYFYEVAPTKIVRANSATFTYASSRKLPLGAFVRIPVGKSTLLGVVVAQTTKPSYATKDVAEQLSLPPFPEQLVHTALWMSEYYCTHLATVFQTILPRGITKNRREKPESAPSVHRKRTHFLLTKEQEQAVAQLSLATSGTVLIHGVTGSGKTAVYITYAKKLLAEGKSVVVLVPEIALTSQLVAEFQHYFSDIILTHSRQTEAERHRSWLEALNSSKPRVAIGPRSALFLPLKQLGAIIIDEAHEPSFKQDQSPKYSALRVAGVLAKLHNGIVVQGSATPLVSEYYLAKHYHRPILDLPTRATKNAKEPEITVVDMTKKDSFRKHRFLSDALLAAIDDSLANKHQVLLFHNRRGSASTTLCQSCGWSALCPRCIVPYTLHADIHQLRCHICDSRAPVPTSCPECHSTEVIHKGMGTKLIAAELEKLYPNNKIVRFDGDSKQNETVEQQYQALYDGTIDIIVGTQVIAKGLDLPELRTVGVIQADAGLSLPDFAAPERTFQLLAQVVGRVGRYEHNTQVIIQSYQPSAPAVLYGVRQNYEQFYTETLETRRKGMFPPFVFLLKLTCTYKTEAAAVRNAQKLATTLRHTFPDVQILGPTPAFYERQRDTYRWQLVVKSAHRATLLSVIDTLPAKGWQYDIDPASLL